MPRYRIDIAYDGTAYAGWQIQPGHATVQDTLERVLFQLTREHTKVHGSGRTDQGVHARRQVAHFDLEKELPPRAMLRGLNAVLPDDIRVGRAVVVDAGFHARRSAINKEYRYFICNADVVSPFLQRYRTHVKRKLDVEAMREAAAYLQGRHDFAAFTANPRRDVESTVRTLHTLRVVKRGHEIVIVAAGEGFLYKMVRSLAGWLIRVGDGSVSASETPAVLRSASRTARVCTAPPEGLFLWDVGYAE